MARVWLAVALVLGVAGPGWGATLQGLTLPDSVPVGGRTLVLNGMAIRTMTILNVKVYVAGLYVTERNRDAAAILASPGPKVILMQFLHAASKSDIEKQYREGQTNNCSHGECSPADATDYDDLIRATPGAKVGDTLSYVISGDGLRVLFNNKEIGSYRNPSLAREILQGFIGAHPPSADVKAHLLGIATD